MIDREKVICGLKCCTQQSGGPELCEQCPYYDAPFPCSITLFHDAIAMLKEQEAVAPTFKQGDDGIFVWCCGSCGAYMYHIYEGIDKAKEYAKYCRCCGRKVKWDD